jgi:hypothetical protein
VTDPRIASLRSQITAKNRKKNSGFPVSDRICLVSDIEPFTNKFSFTRMLAITDLVEFAAFLNELARGRDFEKCRIERRRSLGSH